MRRRWLVAYATAVALSVAACSGAGPHQTSSSSPFGAEAVAWREARYAAGDACVANLVRFFDNHVVVEERAVGRWVTADRSTFLSRYRKFAMDRGAGTCDPVEPMAFLLSADESLDQFYYPAFVSWDHAFHSGVVLATVGPRGYTHVMTSAPIERWRAQVPAVPDLDRLEELADRYVAVWNGSGGVDPADVYERGASVKDTLLGLSVQGLTRLRVAVGSGEWPDLPPMGISVLPERVVGGSTSSRLPRARAIYFSPAIPGTAESDQMILLLQVDDGSGCPGVVGAAMAVERGRIAWERRYHAVDAVRRCFDTSALEPGWWEGIDIPEPVVHELTGVVTWAEPSRSVEVYNGAPEMNAYVRWGLQRFADAGLTLPKVDSVTFVAQQSTCPLERRGLARYNDSGGSVFLCFQPDQVCDDVDCTTWTSDAGQTLLHECSHLWMAQNLTQSTQEAFMRLVGVSRWENPNDDWDQRGVEQAANTIMFGLMNEPLSMEPAACQAFAAKFKLLTGVDPLAPCSP